MYSRFAIQTRLSIDEAEHALERLVDVRHDECTIKAFVGRVESGTFKFHRVISGRNSFLPIVTGRIVQAEGGALVLGVMRLQFFVAAFVTFWMGLVIDAGVHEVRKYLAGSGTASDLGVLFMPLFGAVLITVGYYPERRKAMSALTGALQQNASCREDGTS